MKFYSPGIVGSLDGHVLLLEVTGQPGSFSVTERYKGGFVGSLGAHNSILIGDYATNGSLNPAPDGKPELYIAGSFGLRRLDVN